MTKCQPFLNRPKPQTHVWGKMLPHRGMPCRCGMNHWPPPWTNIHVKQVGNQREGEVAIELRSGPDPLIEQLDKVHEQVKVTFED